MGLVVSTCASPTQCGLDSIPHADRPEVAIDQLQAREAREPLIGELDREISIDSFVNFAIF